MTIAGPLRRLEPLLERNDSALVALARANDEPAIRELIRRYNQRLFRAARAVTGNDADAEDVVQAAYVNAFRHLDRLEQPAHFATWLTRIAINEALARLRRRRPLVGVEAIDALTAQGQVVAFPTVQVPPNPENEMSRVEIRAMLERAVDGLPPPFRMVFVLRDVEELSVEETAAQLALNPSTVRTRLYRARHLLRRAIEREISGSFGEIFPFDGARCATMADRVVTRLRTENAGSL